MDEMLTRWEMMEHIEEWDFRMAFVGMSNCGKSYKSRLLQARGDFFWYEVDREIQKKMWFETMQEIADWMWDPSDDWFDNREKIYLENEESCTYLKDLNTQGKNLVFDTTGSVIYLNRKTRDWLKNECLIVNIDVGVNAIPKMLQRYLDEPKPVSWNGMLDSQEWESKQESLARCYPKLLKDRLRKYKELSHITIPVQELHDLTAEQTIVLIWKYLSNI